jgi:hypothetical protein
MATCLAILAPAAHAAGPPAKAASGARTAGSLHSTVIMGSAWGANNAPIPGAHVQLRNVINGKVVASAVADDAGRFAFADLESGTYAVEMVTEAGKVVSIGHAFSIAPGESVATFVRLGTNVRLGAHAPWFSAFFSNTAAAFSNTATAVTTSAASQGVTALERVQYPSSPR